MELTRLEPFVWLATGIDLGEPPGGADFARIQELLDRDSAWYDNRQTRTIRRCAIADDMEPTAIGELAWG